MKKVRCAIYTRKSSEEGLEQDFNSLHAQREACAAYVLSQASEGWNLLPDEYDDGGISGGTLERPGLRRLLADIAAGRIDIVVVYKVDRLTRSLLDFSKLVEALDKAEVSFVSVTQSFNTTTSMGRLTLNMLLSFAQFEREVTAERIRDKIAASKARGMWMGGVPPVGYKPDGRSLAIVEEHAAIVRHVFDRYLELGSVRLVHRELDCKGIHLPARTTGTGRAIGGRPFSRGQLYQLLSNPIYVGEIHHRGKAHPANHTPLVTRETWEAAQRPLQGNTQGDERQAHVRSPSMLADKLVDAGGDPLIATHASKQMKGKAGKVRYRYYVSKTFQHNPDTAAEKGMRIPAREIEASVTQRVAKALDDPLALLADAGISLEPDEFRSTLARAEKLATSVRAKEFSVVRKLVDKATASPRSLDIELSVSGLAGELNLTMPSHAPAGITLTAPVRMTRTGYAVRLIHSDGRSAVSPKADPSLINLLTLARQWWSRLATGETDIATIARTDGVNDSWVSRVVRVNFLAPRIVEAILVGTQPAELTATTIMVGELPIDWNKQVEMYAAA